MQLYTWIFYGLLGGLSFAKFFPSANKGGMVSYVFLGILGALEGGFFIDFVTGTTLNNNLMTSIGAVAGTAMLLLLREGLASFPDTSHKTNL